MAAATSAAPPHRSPADAPALRAPVVPEFLSVKEVAVILDVHEVTVRRLIGSRKLAAVRVGRLVKVRRAALAAYCRAYTR